MYVRLNTNTKILLLPIFQVWFKNRRVKENKRRKAEDSPALPPAPLETSSHSSSSFSFNPMETVHSGRPYTNNPSALMLAPSTPIANHAVSQRNWKPVATEQNPMMTPQLLTAPSCHFVSELHEAYNSIPPRYTTSAVPTHKHQQSMLQPGHVDDSMASVGGSYHSRMVPTEHFQPSYQPGFSHMTAARLTHEHQQSMLQPGHVDDSMASVGGSYHSRMVPTEHFQPSYQPGFSHMTSAVPTHKHQQSMLQPGHVDDSMASVGGSYHSRMVPTEHFQPSYQ